MIHLRIDDGLSNSKAEYACGLTGTNSLPAGDTAFYSGETHLIGAYLASHPEVQHCPGCWGEKRPEFGTPLSKLSGRPGEPGYEEFCRIARSWGYD